MHETIINCHKDYYHMKVYAHCIGSHIHAQWKRKKTLVTSRPNKCEEYQLGGKLCQMSHLYQQTCITSSYISCVPHLIGFLLLFAISNVIRADSHTIKYQNNKLAKLILHHQIAFLHRHYANYCRIIE